jgi:hypothetical protein
MTMPSQPQQRSFLTQEQKDEMLRRNAETNAIIKLGLWKNKPAQKPTVDKTQTGATPIVNQQASPVADNTPPPVVPTNQQAIKSSMGSSSNTITSSTNYANGAVNPFGVNLPQQPQYQFNNDDVLEKLFAEKPNRKPVINEADQKRLKARGWLDALGRVAMNVGDQLTLSAGGIPVKREPSNTNEYIDKYYKNQTDHQKAVQDWENEDYLRRLRAGSLLTNQRDQDRNFKANRADSNTQNWKWGETQKANQDYRKEVLRQNEAQRQAQTKQQGDASARWWAEFNEKYPKEYTFNYQTSQGEQKLIIPRKDYPAKLKELYSQASNDPEMQLLYPEMFEQTTRLDARGNKVPGPVKLIEEDPTIVIQKWLDKGNVGSAKWLNEGKQSVNPVNIMGNTPGLTPHYIAPGEPSNINPEMPSKPPSNQLNLTQEDATYLNERMDFYKNNPNSNAIPDMIQFLKMKGVSPEQAKEIIKQGLNQ